MPTEPDPGDRDFIQMTRSHRAFSADKKLFQTQGSKGNVVPSIGKPQVVSRLQCVYRTPTAAENAFSNGSGSGLIVKPFTTPPQLFVSSSPKNFESAFEKLNWQHLHDPASVKDADLGRRVGFYKLKSELGTGNFSKVKMAVHQLTKEKVAVKIISKSRLDSKTQRMVLRETQIMDSISHPNLIRLFEVVETPSGIHLVMEFAPEGELFARLTEEGPFEEDEAKDIFAQIASAIEYMHDHCFIHRDLKAENVFFAESRNADLSCPVVKVGDFGFATQINSMSEQLNTFCGSPPYAAPELFRDDFYLGPSVDIWALGILLYFIVTGTMPFKGSTVNALKHCIIEGRFEVPGSVSEPCADLIRGILRKQPHSRLSITQIRESEWLEGAHWPQPDLTYKSIPSRTDDQIVVTKSLSPEEQKVRQQLQTLGIDSQLLESKIPHGARSPVIGTYRILMHRMVAAEMKKQREAIEWSIESLCTSLKSRTGSAGTTGTCISGQSCIRDRSINASQHNDRNGSKSRQKRSKFCNIL